MGVIEVSCPNRQVGRRDGKTDDVDAIDWYKCRSRHREEPAFFTGRLYRQ